MIYFIFVIYLTTQNRGSAVSIEISLRAVLSGVAQSV
jgi:hypothetical protein